MRNRYVIAGICILLATVIGIVTINAQDKKFSSRITVIKMKKNIRKGTQISNDDIDCVEMGQLNLPKTILVDKNDIIGKYATTDLFNDDILTESKVSKSDPSSVPLTSLTGKRAAMSISIKSFASGLSGKLEPGDIVSLVTNDSQSFCGAQILPELTYVEILSVTRSSGEDVNQQNSDEKLSESEKIPVTLTVLVNKRQAALLCDAENNGNIHAVLIFRGDKDKAQKFLQSQENFFEKGDTVK